MAPRRSKAGDDAQAQGPRLTTGDWRGEFVGGGSLSYGQIDQPGPPLHVVEFSYIVAPIIVRSPENREWGGVVMIMAPPRGEPLLTAGDVLQGPSGPTIHLSLNANRAQFSDVVRHLEAGHLKGLRFTLVPADEGKIRLSGWHLTFEFPSLDSRRTG